MSLTTLRTEAIAALCGPIEIPLTAIFEWWSTNPMELRMTLSLDEITAARHGVAQKVTWYFARQLLDAAITHPGETFGQGDVQIRTVDGLLDFGLVGDHGGRHHVIVDFHPVWSLMVRSYIIVPAARETVDVDTAISQLLGETA